jgi:hypothetical protein
MAKIVDPDFLSQGTEVVFHTGSKTIQLVKAGNLSDDGVTLQALYSFCKEQWRSDPNLIRYPFPIEAITPEQFELINGWDFHNTTTRNLIRDAGWALKDTSGNTLEEWMGFITLGDVGPTDQIYYQQAAGATPTNVVLTGPANQAVQIYGDATHGNFDRRSYFKCFVREFQKTYSQAQLSDIGVTTMTYQVYRFPLANALDLKVTHSMAEVATGAAYQNITVTYYSSPVTRTIGGTPYQFNKIIYGDGKAAEIIYEKIQYLLKQASDIDSGTGSVRGDVADALLKFVGDTLVTSNGVYIDSFNALDTNRIDFYDVGGAKRNYPYVAAGTINFSSTLLDDPNVVWKMFFTSNPAGDFGTSGAVVVQDNDNNPIQGSNPSGPVTFTFNYDNNTQGGRTAGTDAAVTIVAIGLGGAQYVKATGTITRSTSNSFSLVAPLERNYRNP